MSSIMRPHAWALGAALLVTAACDNYNNNLTEPFGSVVTVVDSGPALRNARTFVMPDTVVRLRLEGSSVGPTMAAALLASVRGHFLEMGWTELPDNSGSHPDVLILVAASTQIETGVVYGDWYSSWGYLPYWGSAVDPSWAWDVPGGAIPYAYQAGTLHVTMLEVGAPRDPTTKKIPLLWAAALDGVVGDASTLVRIRDGIDQAFEQSPYLRLN